MIQISLKNNFLKQKLRSIKNKKIEIKFPKFVDFTEINKKFVKYIKKKNLNKENLKLKKKLIDM